MRAATLRNTRSTVPVAARPDEGAATYAQVRRDAEIVSLDGAFVNSATPPGCFAISVRNRGGAQTYWFRGSFGHLNARVVARNQAIDGQPVHFLGGSIRGGRLCAPRGAVA